MTGVAIIADAYFLKQNGKKRFGYYTLILGLYLEWPWMVLDQ
jgi:hypothetical protein